jgi:hypothetical protein
MKLQIRYGETVVLEGEAATLKGVLWDRKGLEMTDSAISYTKRQHEELVKLSML